MIRKIIRNMAVGDVRTFAAPCSTGVVEAIAAAEDRKINVTVVKDDFYGSGNVSYSIVRVG